jgi:drug/metabolite transporter (DMT)-like permease
MSGYIIVLLIIISNAGALMILRQSFGGGLDTQAAGGVLVIMSTVGVGLAYYNIKRLWIDQHRAWMLRTWFYVSEYLSLIIHRGGGGKKKRVS